MTVLQFLLLLAAVHISPHLKAGLSMKLAGLALLAAVVVTVVEVSR